MMSKHDEALLLAEEILGDIELNRLPAAALARKASRLARLTNDLKGMLWLYYEVVGYPEGGSGLDQLAWDAAIKSNRVYMDKGKQYARTTGLGQLEKSIQSGDVQLAAAADVPHQISSANPHQFVQPPTGNTLERNDIRNQQIKNQGILDKVVGSLHLFVLNKYQELRFGAAVESAFETIRNTVDSRISSLVPDALPILNTALENASGDNPVQWVNGAKACRDLIKLTADTLRPPGDPVNGMQMDDKHYLNRLMEWIQTKSDSQTRANLVKSDLNDLGTRLDAVNDSGNKGAHVIEVSKADASRYIVGTYMLLGDILGLSEVEPSIHPQIPTEEVVADSAQGRSQKSNTNAIPANRAALVELLKNKDAASKTEKTNSEKVLRPDHKYDATIDPKSNRKPRSG